MNRIKEKREAAGLKQIDLYTKLGWPQSRLSNYENGLRTPGLDDARLIVRALNDLGVSCHLDGVFPDPADQNAA